jgi:hypothetical protein
LSASMSRSPNYWLVTEDDGKTGYISHTRARNVDNLF